LANNSKTVGQFANFGDVARAMNSSIGNYSIINNDNSVNTEKSEIVENDVITSDINILN